MKMSESHAAVSATYCQLRAVMNNGQVLAMPQLDFRCEDSKDSANSQLGTMNIIVPEDCIASVVD